MTNTEWTARRILGSLADPELRKTILTSFWKQADQGLRAVTTAQLAKAMRFREETIRKAPAEKKAEWLGSRIQSVQLEDAFEAALMVFHTTRQKEMLTAFLDRWAVPHNEGSIEEDDYKVPSSSQVSEAVEALKEQFPLREIAVYLASAGLLMGGEWRDATWPVVDKYAHPLQ